MITTALDTLVALWFLLMSAIGGTVEIREANTAYVESSYGAANGVTECSDWRFAGEWVCEGHPVVTLARGKGQANAFAVMSTYFRGQYVGYDATRNFQTLVHELIHAYDLADDGRFNGLGREVVADARNAHCSADAAESYVCEVLRTGELR